MESELRIDLVIKGTVQGIGYRYFVKKKAESLCIKGSIKNLPDGSVFVSAQGTNEALETFVRYCFKGPPGAIVREIEKMHSKIGSFNEFNILF